MQRREDHDHLHGGNGGGGGQRLAPRTAQWQAPERANGYERYYHHNDEPDLDLIENAFAESFATASDPSSFLRLARIPFEAADGAGTWLVLLRVDCDAVVEVGSLSPPLGGGPMRYAPLPRRMATRRRVLRFVYFAGTATRKLTLGEARALTEAQGPP
jgi:hypothetical protein